MPVTKLDPKTALLAMCAAGAVKLEPIDLSATGDTGTEEVKSLVSINVSRLEAVLASIDLACPDDEENHAPVALHVAHDVQ